MLWLNIAFPPCSPFLCYCHACFIADKELVAYVDTKLLSFPTIRHVDCHVVLHPSLKGSRCVPCMNYRPTLRSSHLRQTDKTAHSSKTNERWMTSQELKGKIQSLKKDNKATVAKLKRTEAKLARLIEEESIEVAMVKFKEVLSIIHTCRLIATSVMIWQPSWRIIPQTFRRGTQKELLVSCFGSSNTMLQRLKVTRACVGTLS